MQTIYLVSINGSLDDIISDKYVLHGDIVGTKDIIQKFLRDSADIEVDFNNECIHLNLPEGYRCYCLIPFHPASPALDSPMVA